MLCVSELDACSATSVNYAFASSLADELGHERLLVIVTGSHPARIPDNMVTAFKWLNLGHLRGVSTEQERSVCLHDVVAEVNCGSLLLLESREAETMMHRFSRQLRDHIRLFAVVPEVSNEPACNSVVRFGQRLTGLLPQLEHVWFEDKSLLSRLQTYYGFSTAQHSTITTFTSGDLALNEVRADGQLGPSELRDDLQGRRNTVLWFGATQEEAAAKELARHASNNRDREFVVVDDRRSTGTIDASVGANLPRNVHTVEHVDAQLLDTLRNGVVVVSHVPRSMPILLARFESLGVPVVVRKRHWLKSVSDSIQVASSDIGHTLSRLLDLDNPDTSRLRTTWLERAAEERTKLAGSDVPNYLSTRCLASDVAAMLSPGSDEESSEVQEAA